MKYYIASCMFTSKYPELSKKIQDYVASRADIAIVRCCIPGWKTKMYEDIMPEGELANAWAKLPQSRVFTPNDAVWSLCPNCINILEEWRGVTKIHSLWELIASDADFPYPDYTGMTATIQDCWRLRDRTASHDAVRKILSRMNINYLEIPMNREKADFCGKTLYSTQIERNPKLAPRHYRDNAEGLFMPHDEEEQIRLMVEHCRQYKTDKVICYCHYCLEGLLDGGVDANHLAELLFM